MPVTALVVSLGAAALWGAADFVGGLSARRLHVLAVTLWSQLAGLVTIAVVTLLAGAAASTEGLLWGAAAGVVGSLALALFYAALAAGTMSIVAPLSALGALVPVAVALFGGERLPALTWAGMALALAGAVLASRQPTGAVEAVAVPGAGAPAAVPHARAAGPATGPAAAAARGAASAPPEPQGPSRPAPTHAPALTPRVLALALGAALGIGIVLALLQQGAQAEGSSGLSTTAAARVASVLVTLGAVALLRVPTGMPADRRAAVFAVGAADTGANALFAIASTAGQDALVAVLASLYPVVTVLLARVALGERLSRGQGAGVGVALVGVALASVS